MWSFTYKSYLYVRKSDKNYYILVIYPYYQETKTKYENENFRRDNAT